MDTECRHARRWAHRLVVTLVGAALAVPPLALAPAQGAEPQSDPGPDVVLGFLTAVEPVISGAGSVTSTVAGLTCTNPTGATDVTCSGADGLSLDELSLLSSVVLTAVPADGWEFTGWSGCSTVVGTSCTVDSGLLDPVLAPTATFAPLPCVPGVSCDEEAPFTKLTTTPAVVAGNKTKEKAASFAFTASDDEAGETPTEEASFGCELTGPGQPAGFAPCPTPKAYENLADGTYTFKVQASDPSGNTDATPETFTWTVDTTAPETTVSGPKGWVLASKLTFGLGSSEPGSSFRCTLDGSGRFCNAAGGTVSFAAGTHTFAALARDSLGHEDATPATRTFTLPVNNTELKHSTGWKKATGSGYFMKSKSSSTKKGAVLKTSSSAITSVALVVTKGKGYGVVKVFLGKKLLKKVSLSAKRTKKQKLVQIASFAAARSGTIKVVVASSNKLVVVEGLGIASR